VGGAIQSRGTKYYFADAAQGRYRRERGEDHWKYWRVYVNQEKLELREQRKIDNVRYIDLPTQMS
jgi:hypothetical protein